MSSAGALPGPTWSPRRRCAAGLFAVAGLVGAACVVSYLAGVLFLILSKTDPRQAGPTSIAHYWRLYSADTVLRKRLQTAITAAFGLVILPAAGLLASARTRRPLHGDARFATRAEIERAGFFSRDGSPAILLGRDRGRFLSLRGQLSVMLSAPTRSGKGVGVVIPNLLNWPDSVVVLDIKGENYDITAGYRAAHGQAVYAFSPFDEDARSHRWNPLETVRADPLHRVGDLLAIAQIFFPSESGSTSSEAFFNDQARSLFMGLGLLLLETPALPRTMGEMLRQSSGKGQPLKEHLISFMQQRKQGPRPLSQECTDALQRLLSNSDNTLTSIVATFNAPLTLFADAVVDAATSASDFRVDETRRRRMSIYVRIPPNRLATAKPLLNLFFSQLILLNTRHLPEQDPTLTLQCLLIHDEFTAMGRVPIISSAAGFLAGYNLRLLTVVQAMSQLDVVYGEKDARSFATNHGVQILFAPREQRDADEYSAMLGHYTERCTSRGRSQSFSAQGQSSISSNESEQRRALLLPQEFKELGSERLVLISEGCKPILAEKIRYHRDPAFVLRLRAPPLVPRMDMELHFARIQERWRYADDNLPDEKTIQVEDMAYNLSALPDQLTGSPEDIASLLLDFLEGAGAAQDGTGGQIEPLGDTDGVLIHQQQTFGAPPAPIRTQLRA
ncbi:type IV secretory system conjugative DNA transfer family protein [Paucibacter sp. B51]|uniref:type IV secretory system conjugative DNA transfer family protein n=1 Tax=Paucibacter sp. B51 TaxID=2993315 RepID=UPI0022EBAC33|nr:type IV secretory system conjugative DNA transfer family protein [Paucibacter sp. B51]